MERLLAMTAFIAVPSGPTFAQDGQQRVDNGKAERRRPREAKLSR